jgi:serine/threonine-protein kinase HipA
LRALRADHSQWRSAQDTGQFSLAGAKPKTAVLFERQRCGCEVGSSSDHSRSQTTDRQMGRPGGERAFFAAFGQSCGTDRSQLHRPALWRRDRNCGGAFRTACEAEDAGHASLMRTFVRRLVFILRTSMEVKRRGTTCAALRFSKHSALPLEKAKLAMKLGGEYRLRNIRLRPRKRFATDLRLDEPWLTGRIRTMAASVPDHATSIRNELVADGLSHITIPTGTKAESESRILPAACTTQGS